MTFDIKVISTIYNFLGHLYTIRKLCAKHEHTSAISEIEARAMYSEMIFKYSMP